MFVSSYKFYTEYENEVPYNTMMSYDAKILEFVKKYGENDDFIWNVGGVHQYLLS